MDLIGWLGHFKVVYSLSRISTFFKREDLEIGKQNHHVFKNIATALRNGNFLNYRK